MFSGETRNAKSSVHALVGNPIESQKALTLFTMLGINVPHAVFWS